MFGFVKPFIPDLRVKEYEFYKSVYCGLCRSMKKHLGGISALTLSYDITFLALLRLALVFPDPHIEKRTCAVHPFKKRPMADDNPAIEYAAGVGAVLSYYKCIDGRADEKGFMKLFYTMLLPYMKKADKKAANSEADSISEKGLSLLSGLEKVKCPIADEAAAAFGGLLSGLCSLGLSGDEAIIASEIGFHLGKWIYFADASVDYESDKAKGRYNPFIYAFTRDDEASGYIKNTLPEAMSLELAVCDRALALIKRTGNAAIYSCLENIIQKGTFRAYAEAMAKGDKAR